MCFEKRDAAYAEVCLERDSLKKKLAAYENTGVTPEEIVHIKNGIERVWKLLQDIDEEKLKHLEELVDAENEGRLVVLPCKVGDTVYFRTWTKNATVDCGIQPHTVTQIEAQIGVQGEFFTTWLSEREFGKTVFLTREEAEAALAADKMTAAKKVNDLYDEEGGEILNE